jgi:hypothetical protein
VCISVLAVNIGLDRVTSCITEALLRQQTSDLRSRFCPETIPRHSKIEVGSGEYAIALAVDGSDQLKYRNNFIDSRETRVKVIRVVDAVEYLAN